MLTRQLGERRKPCIVNCGRGQKTRARRAHIVRMIEVYEDKTKWEHADAGIYTSGERFPILYACQFLHLQFIHLQSFIHLVLTRFGQTASVVKRTLCVRLQKGKPNKMAAA